VDADAELGRLADEQVMAEVRPLRAPELEAYLGGVLASITRHANPTASRWHLRLLDSSHVSVRSGPGGFVYVTRGLLACLGSEAELAAALAHEVAHVSMRHWRRQAEYLVQHGVDDGDISKLRPDHRLELLARLREEERDADRLAVGYLERAGYSREGLVDVVRLFSEIERLAGGSRVPALLRTHPESRVRLAAIAQRATRGGARKSREYLTRIEGLPFGEDPREGYLFGDRYLVPSADFMLTLPPAWRAQLVGRDLMAALPGQASVLLVARSEHGSLDRTLDALDAPQKPGETTLGGHRALEIPARAESGVSSLTWVFDTKGAPLVLALIVPRGREHDSSVTTLLGSVARIADPALRDLGPLRVRLTELRKESSLRALDAEQPSHTNLATLSLINGVGPDQALAAGTLVKRIAP